MRTHKISFFIMWITITIFKQKLLLMYVCAAFVWSRTHTPECWNNQIERKSNCLLFVLFTYWVCFQSWSTNVITWFLTRSLNPELCDRVMRCIFELCASAQLGSINMIELCASAQLGEFMKIWTHYELCASGQLGQLGRLWIWPSSPLEHNSSY